MNKFITLVAGALFMLTSCIHKDLCMHHDEHAHKYHVLIDADYRCEWEEWMDPTYTNWKKNWPDNYIEYESLLPGIPKGLRVVNYPEDGPEKISNIEAEGGIVYFSEGTHDILFYNNDTEYIVMEDLGMFASTRATTRTRTRSTYTGSPFGSTKGEEVTVNPPDMLYGSYINDYLAKKLPQPEVIPVTMHPLVFTYKIRFEFAAGLKYVALARGTLAGMALSVNLSTGTTSNEAATILYDCEVKDWGVAAYVNSFGVPGYPNGAYTKGDQIYAVNLEVRMRNGKIKSFDFDVTDQVSKQPHGGVIVIDGIEINDDEGMSGSGAFDVTVKDWGEYEDITIPLI